MAQQDTHSFKRSLSHHTPKKDREQERYLRDRKKFSRVLASSFNSPKERSRVNYWIRKIIPSRADPNSRPRNCHHEVEDSAAIQQLFPLAAEFFILVTRLSLTNSLIEEEIIRERVLEDERVSSWSSFLVRDSPVMH